MADDRDESERSEDPTQKRLDDALERGDVVKSQEVNTWFILGAALLALYAFAGDAMRSLNAGLRSLLGNAHTIRIDNGVPAMLAQRIGFDTLTAMAIPFLLLALAAICGNIIQHRLVWTTKSMQPKVERISPIAGAKRLFSKQALVNFVKGLLKVALIGVLMVWLIWPDRTRLEGFVASDVTAVLPAVEGLTLKLLAAVAAVLAVIAALDYFYQYHVWFNRQKMSVRDMKEEFKQSEGDPHIKAKLRQLRQSRMRQRIMSAVPEASVIITNPTHFAVALKYEPGMNAPLCVAKGVDSLALKIREVAGKHAVPIVENPPLARALHASVDIDEEIPMEHYKAVAEVIGYVMGLRRTGLR